MKAKPSRTHRALSVELGRVERMLPAVKKHVIRYSQWQGAMQALSWALNDNAQPPSRCLRALTTIDKRKQRAEQGDKP